MKVVNVDKPEEVFTLSPCKDNAVPSHYEKDGAKTELTLNGHKVTAFSNTGRTKYVVVKNKDAWLYTANSDITKMKALKTYVKPEPVKKEKPAKKADKPAAAAASKKAEPKKSNGKAAPKKTAAKKPAAKKEAVKTEAPAAAAEPAKA